MLAKIVEPNEARGKIPVLLCHAFPLNSSMWNRLTQVLDNHHYPYIVIDYPGFGKNDMPAEMATFADFAFVLSHLLDETGIEQVIPVGLSMGGYIALEFAARFSWRVKGLVLANTNSIADSPEKSDKRFRIIEELEKSKNPEPLFDAHIPLFYTPKTIKNNPELVKETYEIMRKNRLDGIIEATRAMALRQDHTDFLQSFTEPYLVISSDMDSLLTEDILQKLLSGPHAEEIRLHQCAHMTALESPDLFNAALIQYLNKF